MSYEDYRLFGLAFHDIIVSYQAAIRDIMGNSDAAVMNLVGYLSENVKLRSVDVDSLKYEELVTILARQIKNMNLGKIRLEKVSQTSYLFHVEDCVWAEFTHRRKNARDITCPWGLIALSLYQLSTGEKVFVPDSEYSPTGSTTKIRPITDILNQINVDEKW